MGDDRPRLVRTDLESEACFDQMKAIITEELQARIDVGDRNVDDPAWLDRIALLVTDALIDSFQVRPRLDGTRRYQRER